MNINALVAALRGNTTAPQRPDLLTEYRQYVLRMQEAGQKPVPQEQWAQQQRIAGS